MKNKIIFMISAALLLTSLSAFAEDTISSKTINIKNTSVNNNIKNSLQNAYAENQAKESDPQEEIKAICKDNKYCLENASILSMLGFNSEELIYELKNIQDHKQKLYDMKYSISTDAELYFGFITFEIPTLTKITEFNKMKEYIIDMPATPTSFIFILKKIKNTAKSQEEIKFVNSLIEKYAGKLFPQNFEEIDGIDFVNFLESNEPYCPKNLNANNYGFDNLCFLPLPFGEVDNIQIKQGSSKNLFKRNYNIKMSKERIGNKRKK